VARADRMRASVGALANRIAVSPLTVRAFVHEPEVHANLAFIAANKRVVAQFVVVGFDHLLLFVVHAARGSDAAGGALTHSAFPNGPANFPVETVKEIRAEYKPRKYPLDRAGVPAGNPPRNRSGARLRALCSSPRMPSWCNRHADSTPACPTILRNQGTPNRQCQRAIYLRCRNVGSCSAS
jgi:hypothetical protein